MSWILIAVVATAILGLVNMIDSYLLSKRMPDLYSYMLPVGAVYFIVGIGFTIAAPPPSGVPAGIVFLLIGSNVCRAAGIIIMLYSLRTQEVSRVVPVVYAYPVLVALMAAPLLGEKLDHFAWLAVFIVVTGAIMVSVRRNGGTTRLPGRSLLLLVLTGVLFALTDLSTKYVLAYYSFWTVFATTALMLGVGFGATCLRPATLRTIRGMPGRNSALGLVVFNEILASVGILLYTRAVSTGPVSLASTILGSRPLFVSVFAVVIGYFAPGFLAREPGRSLPALKFAGTAMIVGGIALIYLG